MKHKKMTCILCPDGCELEVSLIDDGAPQVVKVAGNLCPKGCGYAIEEITQPTRTLTTTVLVRSGVRPLVSVRTNTPIPKEALGEALKVLRSVSVPAPVHLGELIVEDVAGTGVAVVATRSVPRTLTKGGET